MTAPVMPIWQPPRTDRVTGCGDCVLRSAPRKSLGGARACNHPDGSTLRMHDEADAHPLCPLRTREYRLRLVTA